MGNSPPFNQETDAYSLPESGRVVNSFYEIEGEALAFLRGIGLLVDHIVWDAGIQKVGTTDKPRSKNGRYKAHSDPPVNVSCWDFGAGGEEHKWIHGNGKANYTPAEREAFRRQVEENKRARADAEARKFAKGAKEAQRRYDAAGPCSDDNPHLTGKGVKAVPGLKISKQIVKIDGKTFPVGSLITPVLDESGAIVSLHYTQPNTEPDNKRLLSGGRQNGCYFFIAGEDATKPHLICEGLTTALSLYQSFNGELSVWMAINAGNLPAVARFVRSKYPDREIILCADYDKPSRGHPGPGGTGLAKANEAARAVGGSVAVPEHPDKPGEKVDWNDIHLSWGAETVVHQFEKRYLPGDAGKDDTVLMKSENKAQAPPVEAANDNSKPVKAAKAPDPTEDDLALEFVEIHGKRYRFCHTSECWYRWDNTHWTRDRKKNAFALMRVICRRANLAGKASVARFLTTRGALNFASIDPLISITSEIWDSDPWMLGTPGGVVNLKTGKVEKADPATHMITKQAGAGPAKEEDCPLWLKFLNEATKGDKEVQAFLKRAVGYCLTGSIKEHALFFVFGDGGTGKGTFLNTITELLGDYAKTAAMTTFTENKHDGHPEDMAMLDGARLVSTSETEEGRAWAEAKVKAMTGGDRITACFKYGHNFTFLPRFKLFIISNHQPALRNVGDAMRRRINMIPFVTKPTEKDLDLEEKLRAELSGIMRWAINGCLDWQEKGLSQPHAVETATDEYFEAQDVIGQWLEECCDDLRGEPSGVKVFTPSAELFASWRTFAEVRRIRPQDETRFIGRLKEAKFENDRRRIDGSDKKRRGIVALMLKEEQPQRDGRMAAAGELSEPPEGRFPEDDPGTGGSPW